MVPLQPHGTDPSVGTNARHDLGSSTVVADVLSKQSMTFDERRSSSLRMRGGGEKYLIENQRCLFCCGSFL